MVGADVTGDRTVDDFVMVEAPEEQSSTSAGHLKEISHHVETLSSDLREISLSIHDDPELQYKEHHAHDVLTNFLSKQEGWQVTPSAYGIRTAFVAVYDTGKHGPVVSFNAEYGTGLEMPYSEIAVDACFADALKGIGHACGHNLIAITSVGAALATAQSLTQHHLCGSVILFGTPAEEGGGGKIKLLDAGAYKDHKVDVSLITHPGIDPDAALVRTAAYQAYFVEYHGKEAHAAARPWDGINALDALITAYNAISVLRQQTQAGDIIQMQIVNGGLRPNIIHAYASGRFVVRSSSKARLSALCERVKSCFEAGATATGARLELTTKMSYDDHVPNHALGRRYCHFFNHLGGSILENQDLDEIRAATQASTDQGNISHAMPSLSPEVWIRSEGEDGEQLGGPHTPDFERAARTEESHGYALRAAKALAAVAVDVVQRPELLHEVKKEFEEMNA